MATAAVNRAKQCAIQVASDRRGYYGILLVNGKAPRPVTPCVDDYIEARDMAREWAEERGYSIVAEDEL